MRDLTPPATGPARRIVTAGALGAVVVTLAGCGIRLEDDAPSIPLVPKREPIAAEDALLRLLAAVQGAAVAPLVTRDPVSPLLPALHARQATVLHDALRQRGVPKEALAAGTPSPVASATPGGSASPTVSGSPSASVSPSTSAPVDAIPEPRSVAEVESAILTAGTGLAGAEAELRPALVALLAQANAAIVLASPERGPVTSSSPVPSPSPTSSPAPTSSSEPPTSPEPPSSATRPAERVWSTPSALVPLITGTRRATFLLEVAAARSSRQVRKAWLEDITALQSLTADLVAAATDAAPAPDLGQTLPRPVRTPAEASTLATEAMSTLLRVFGGTLRSLTDGDPDAAFASVPGWLGTVAAHGHRHGTGLTAFPGLA